MYKIIHIVTYIPIVRQRLGKPIPEVTLSTIGHLLLGNGSINTHYRQEKTVFSVESVRRNYKTAQSGVQRSTKEYNRVLLEDRIVPVECPVGRR
jgi:hypothetical protein